MSEKYSIADSKQTDFGFGVDAQTEDPLRDLTRLALQASPHDLVMGGISRAGSRQDSPGKNSEVGSHALVQRIFPTQGLNPCLLCL